MAASCTGSRSGDDEPAGQLPESDGTIWDGVITPPMVPADRGSPRPTTAEPDSKSSRRPIARPNRCVCTSDSPVPPADGVVTSERLAALLALATEYNDLDYKRMLDLSTTREKVELAKDVGAMNVKGGYIVIGVDGHGNPTGDMDGVDTAVFDAANLVPKMERYMEGPLGITTSV